MRIHTTSSFQIIISSSSSSSSSSGSGSGSGSGSSSGSSSKLLYLHDRKILQYCKSIFIVITGNNKTKLILLQYYANEPKLHHFHLIITMYHVYSYTRK